MPWWVQLAITKQKKVENMNKYYWSIDVLFGSGDVFVTAVKYVRQTSTLVVGFNFGCFQMWNMETLSHV